MGWGRMDGLARAVSGAVLAAGLVVAGSGAVGAAPPPPADTSAVCANVPDGFGGFDDAEATGNADNIECLAYAGITSGTPGGGYNPAGIVTRAQMATFVARLIDAANELDDGTLQALPAAGPDAFADDDGLAPHEENINRLAAAGIVSGSGGAYNPANPVNRAQMATFVNNAHAFMTGQGFTSGEDFFVDDNGLEPHEANINGIAGVGIAAGVTATTYNPAGPVSRNQMASFLVRHLAVLHDAGFIDPLPDTTPSDGGRVDGSITAVGVTCSWTDAITTASPPSTLSIDRDTVNPPAGNGACPANVSLVLENDPEISFDDTAGTATADLLDVSISAAGLNCRYADTDAVVDRDGDTREYQGVLDFALEGGDAGCPANLSAELTVTFH